MTSIIEQIEKNLQPYDYLTPIQRDLLKILEEKGSTKRAVFVRLLKKSRTTIYDNLPKLQKRKIIERFSFNNGLRGRPVVYWRLKK